MELVSGRAGTSTQDSEFRALAFNYYGINVKLAFRFFQLQEVL